MKYIKGVLLFLLWAAAGLANEYPTLLIKIPTRERPHQFFKNLDKFYQKLSFEVPVSFLISCDEDDESMNNAEVIRRLNTYPELTFYFGSSLSKVGACNRDINKHSFDVLLVVHDDMEPLVQGYDKILIERMINSFPDFDGVLNCNDGFVGRQCNTVPVLGKKFYERFGWVYNPEYKALVCNVELTCVSKMLKKEVVVDEVLIKHNHPAWNAGPMDSLYKKNEQFHTADIETFVKRRDQCFDLSEQEIAEATPKVWSILICTIEERAQQFNELCKKLKKQIKNCGLEDKIEILASKDKRGEHTVGSKRNTLLDQSEGKYVSFIDDDDDIHDNYIEMIYEKLCNSPDCVSLTGTITFNGKNPKTFIHSIKYNSYFEHNNVYFRPPNHLNAIKRSVAVQFSFPEKNVGEDTDWAMAIATSGLLKSEEEIAVPYYFYLYCDK